MKFTRITLDELLAEITEVPAGWLDERRQAVLLSIGEVLPRLREHSITKDDLAREFHNTRYFLDIARLFFGVSQDTLTNMISDDLVRRGEQRRTWTQIAALQR